MGIKKKKEGTKETGKRQRWEWSGVPGKGKFNPKKGLTG
jgi:hypothetical protein